MMWIAVALLGLGLTNDALAQTPPPSDVQIEHSYLWLHPMLIELDGCSGQKFCIGVYRHDRRLIGAIGESLPETRFTVCRVDASAHACPRPDQCRPKKGEVEFSKPASVMLGNDKQTVPGPDGKPAQIEYLWRTPHEDELANPVLVRFPACGNRNFCGGISDVTLPPPPGQGEIFRVVMQSGAAFCSVPKENPRACRNVMACLNENEVSGVKPEFLPDPEKPDTFISPHGIDPVPSLSAEPAR